MRKLPFFLTLIFFSGTLFSTSYADDIPQAVIDACEGHWDNEWCRENVLCHEAPQNPRCNGTVERLSPPSSVSEVEAIFCEQNPEFCPFEDPFPLTLPDLDPCLADGCPFPFPYAYYNTLVQNAQVTVLDDKITVMQNSIDTLKIDTVPFPEDKLNLAIGLGVIASIGAVTAAIFSSRRK